VIVFDLKCRPAGHVFEAWFGSTSDYESQKARGLVSCPLCGTGDVGKALMAPNVAPKGNRTAGSPQPQPPEAQTQVMMSSPEEVKAMLAAMAAVQKSILAQSDYVGERFADEARAIHLGETAARSIYGKATGAETESLIEEGIAVAPLPFPVVLPGEEN
jgi:hypothetical protein